ncbi:aspartate/glutamate racemase family protein [Oceanobacillus oncorhynchi subsp. oncorhynchi]|uniref:aspartate/glutamate racemase family protein n=1 Tax=Oceanobacillus oncorhynchi TaxID=545501 RepID=UPI00362E4AB5
MKIAHVLPVSTNSERINNIRKTLNKNLHPDTQLDIITYEKGPKDLEYYVDDHRAISLMMEDSARLNSYDAISVACFYDPGIRELRELLDIPVIGISQASVLLAQTYGYQSGIIISRNKNLPKMKDNMELYGFTKKISCWKSLNMTVQELQKNNQTELLEASAKLTKEAIHNDNAEVIILGCGALSGLEDELHNRFNIPIINPIVAGIKMAETLASLKQTAQLTTSKINDYENQYR